MQHERERIDLEGSARVSSEPYMVLGSAPGQNQSILAQLPCITWQIAGSPISRDCRVVYVSDAATTLLGYAVESLVGKPLGVLAVIHPQDRHRVLAEVRAAYTERREHLFECRMLAHDGSIRWLEHRVSVAVDEAGQPSGMCGIALDISARKMADQDQAELLEAERHARLQAERALERQTFVARAGALLGASLDYEVMMDSVAQLAVPTFADWCIVDIDEHDGGPQRLAIAHSDPDKASMARELWRRSPIDARTASDVDRVMHTGQSELHREASADLADSDEIERELMDRFGFQSSLVVPLIARDCIIGAISFIYAESGRHYTDADVPLAEEIAHRAAIAVDNARLYREAQEAIAMRDEFISIASHELKTPLTSLLGFTELMQRRAAREGHLSERDTRALEIIYDQATRLNRLIANLLDLSRLQGGQLTLERVPVDLAQLVQHVVGKHQLGQSRHTIKVEGCDEPLLIVGDGPRLEQAFQNVLGNAIKYSPFGGDVLITLERRDPQACVTIKDQGIGIPRASIARLFERFYRGSNTDAYQIAGLGLGLYVVKEIVALHDGSIDVQSEENRGSTFKICVPCARQG